MVSFVLARKAYLQNRQYRTGHAIRMAGSVIIGMIYISLWARIGNGKPLGEYGLNGMVSYIAFNQSCIWLLITTFGLGLEEAVRTGQIALDLLRPLNLFVHMVSREAGRTVYFFLYCCIPIYTVYALFIPIRQPERPETWLLTAIALIGTAYISICISYMIGITALWTTESRFLHYLHHALNTLLSGFLIPVEWMPSWLQAVSRCSPYPFLQYHPTRIYMEMEDPHMLIGSIGWSAGLTAVCYLLTRIVRNKVEVQGG